MDAAILEALERDAMIDQLRAAPDELRAKLVLGMSLVDGALVTRLERIDNGWYNRVLGLGVERPARREVLEAAVAGFRAAGIKQFTVQLTPHATPRELPEWLDALGLVPSRMKWAKIVRAPGPSPAPARDGAVRVLPVDPRDALTFGKISCAAWEVPAPLAPWVASLVGRPGWRAYLAWVGSDPVAAGLLFESGELAWLGGDATLPNHRGHGAQSALIARRIADSHGRTLVAEAVDGGGSLRNALGFGFQVAYLRESWGAR